MTDHETIRAQIRALQGAGRCSSCDQKLVGIGWLIGPQNIIFAACEQHMKDPARDKKLEQQLLSAATIAGRGAQSSLNCRPVLGQAAPEREFRTLSCVFSALARPDRCF